MLIVVGHMDENRRISGGCRRSGIVAWIVWCGWRNNSDCVSGLYNDVGLLQNCCRAKSEIIIYSKAYTAPISSVLRR